MKANGLFLFLFFCILNTSAQKMSDVFVQMPDSLLQLLNKEKKIELIGYFENEKETKIENKLYRTSELKALTSDYLFLQTTTQSFIEIKLLPVNEYYRIICLINTYCASGCDSKISFYTTDWKPLKNNYFPIISPTIFFRDDEAGECRKLGKELDIFPVKFSFNQDSLQIKAILSIKDYLNKAEYEKIALCIQDSIVFDWIDGKYQHTVNK